MDQLLCYQDSDLKELSWKSRQEDVDSIVGDLFNKIVKTLLLQAYNKDDDAKVNTKEHFRSQINLGCHRLYFHQIW
jgi:hypothetical protein